jgi:hypothetical protein
MQLHKSEYHESNTCFRCGIEGLSWVIKVVRAVGTLGRRLLCQI